LNYVTHFPQMRKRVGQEVVEIMKCEKNEGREYWCLARNRRGQGRGQSYCRGTVPPTFFSKYLKIENHQSRAKKLFAQIIVTEYKHNGVPTVNVISTISVFAINGQTEAGDELQDSLCHKKRTGIVRLWATIVSFTGDR
ncbi:hypothetical protein ALC57_10105, partial [Trachymyrmex cornetzi]